MREGAGPRPARDRGVEPAVHRERPCRRHAHRTPWIGEEVARRAIPVRAVGGPEDGQRTCENGGVLVQQDERGDEPATPSPLEHVHRSQDDQPVLIGQALDEGLGALQVDRIDVRHDRRVSHHGVTEEPEIRARIPIATASHVTVAADDDPAEQPRREVVRPSETEEQEAGDGLRHPRDGPVDERLGPRPDRRRHRQIQQLHRDPVHRVAERPVHGLEREDCRQRPRRRERSHAAETGETASPSWSWRRRCGARGRP